MSLKHVLLIGAGQLGSRHLQALMMCDNSDVTISVVEPSEHSQNIARERMSEVPSKIADVRFLKAIAEVEGKVDFCVVATNANVRLKILEELLEHCQVDNILLEKILFQSSAHLELAQNLLSRHNVKSWVNCPRRMQLVYHDIKAMIQDEKEIKLTVVGENWGLACNAIHMIDLWAFLTGQTTYKLFLDGLSKNIIDGKRQGYKEISGKMIGRKNNCRFELLCDVSENPVSILHTINTPNYEIVVEEINGKFTVYDRRTGEKSTNDFVMLPQSKLTNLVANAAVDNQRCDLTEFSESSQLHKVFLDGMLDFFNSTGEEKYEKCPIT